jgi:hypothetical protein
LQSIVTYLKPRAVPLTLMAAVDDTVGYQLLSSTYAQYAVREKTVTGFSRKEIPEVIDTVTEVSSDELYPSKLRGSVSITDHKGAFVGRVLASTNTSHQVRQLESQRIRIKGFVNAIASGITNGLSSSESAPHLSSSSGREKGTVSTLHV